MSLSSLDINKSFIKIGIMCIKMLPLVFREIYLVKYIKSNVIFSNAYINSCYSLLIKWKIISSETYCSTTTMRWKDMSIYFIFLKSLNVKCNFSTYWILVIIRKYFHRGWRLKVNKTCISKASLNNISCHCMFILSYTSFFKD